MSFAPLPLFLAALATVPGAASVSAPAERPSWRFHSDYVLGTSLDLTAVGAPAEAVAAARAVADEIARLDLILSGWREDSELSALNRSARFSASPDLYQVVAAAERWRGLSDGAFDGRLGAVEALWRQAELTGVAPDPDRLAQVAGAARAQPIGFEAHTRTLHRPEGAVLALDGLAKGYVIDRALAAALRAAPDLRGLMIDLGGDLRCWGEAPQAGGWTLAVFDPREPADNAPPAAVRQVSAGALATSGCGSRDRRIGAGKASPLLDPRDGRGSRALAAAALAPTAMDADALSTALMVMEPGAGQALARKLGMQALGFDGNGRLADAPGWTRIAAARPAAAGGAWPSGYAVTVEYEAPKIPGNKVYPPYMAVWVTDQNNRLVRALALLGKDPNYIDQNFIWWRRHGRGAPDVVDATSRPTRAPGRYTAVWDGKDDAGRPAPLGKYTVHVEAIREHGGHSYQSMPLDLTQGPGEAQAPGSEELGPARIRYGPRASR